MKLKNIGIVFLFFVFLIINSCSSNTDSDDEDDNSLVDIHEPVLEVVLNEHPYNHNMSITSDGDFYYTINGGGTSVGQIQKFDKDTALVATYPIPIDGRGFVFNRSDNTFYASLFQGHIVKITSLDSARFETLHPSLMQSGQASFALSPDGSKLYNFYNGTLIIHDFLSGIPIDTLTGLSHGSGSNTGLDAVAVDGKYIYTCDTASDTLTTIFVYDNSGTFVTDFQLPYGNYGYSLSVFEGYLFIAIDGNYNVGTWYGYNIRRALSKKGNLSVKSIISNPNNSLILDSTN